MLSTLKRWADKNVWPVFKNDTDEPVMNVEGLVQLANTDGEIIDPASGAGGGAGGGGNNTWSTAQGDFTAVITAGTKNITVTGLAGWTFDWEHVRLGSIIRKTAAGVTSKVDTDTVSVAGGVITLAEEDNFASGDTVSVVLFGPDKAYQKADDAMRVFVANPEYSHNTSVEHVIQADLGITGTAEGTDADTLKDTGIMLAANVAVGYEAYDEEEDVAATVLSITDADNVETDAVTDWTGDTYWLPQCKRFVFPMTDFKHIMIQPRLVVGEANNAAYCKLYMTLDEDADDTSDLYWVDISEEAFGVAQLSVSGVGSSETIHVIDTPTQPLKYMLKIVGEVTGGGGAAVANQDFDIYVKKY